MWRNPSNNYEEYFRDHQPRESAQWRNRTSMEPFNRSTPRTGQDRSVHHQDRSFHHHDRSVHIDRDPDRSFHLQDRSVHHQERSVHTWSDFESFANYAFGQSSLHSRHQEDEEPEDPETISMLLRVLEDRKKRFEETCENPNRPTLHFDSWEVEGDIEEVSNDNDMNVQDAPFPLKEEIEETHKDADMTLKGEVVEVFFPYNEIVVEHQDDHINTQQQSPAGDEVEEFIQLHEDALDEDALALIVAVMNEETLRLNNASIENEKNKEEEEMVQIFELSQKELHQDEAVEPRVPGTPTPRLQHPQGPRKRLEWKIKHKWRIKPRNV